MSGNDLPDAASQEIQRIVRHHEPPILLRCSVTHLVPWTFYLEPTHSCARS